MEQPKLPTIDKMDSGEYGLTTVDIIKLSVDYVIQIELPSMLEQINKLEEQVKELTQQKERFQHNLMYVEVVDDIITSDETEWDKKVFNNMLVKLVGKDEIYKVFVQSNNAPIIGSKIKFTFNADENKLSQLKLLKNETNKDWSVVLA
jgi:hypothetical protein